MFHRMPDDNEFDCRRQIAELDYVTGTRAAVTALPKITSASIQCERMSSLEHTFCRALRSARRAIPAPTQNQNSCKPDTRGDKFWLNPRYAPQLKTLDDKFAFLSGTGEGSGPPRCTARNLSRYDRLLSGSRRGVSERPCVRRYGLRHLQLMKSISPTFATPSKGRCCAIAATIPMSCRAPARR